MPGPYNFIILDSSDSESEAAPPHQPTCSSRVQESDSNSSEAEESFKETDESEVFEEEPISSRTRGSSAKRTQREESEDEEEYSDESDQSSEEDSPEEPVSSSEDESDDEYDPEIEIYNDIPPIIDMRDERNDLVIKKIWRRQVDIRSMPPRLKYIVKYYSRNHDSFLEAREEWEIRDEDPTNEILTSCVCSQGNLYRYFYIRNKCNGNYLRIGSTCVMKFMGEAMRLRAEGILRLQRLEERGQVEAKRQRT